MALVRITRTKKLKQQPSTQCGKNVPPGKMLEKVFPGRCTKKCCVRKCRKIGSTHGFLHGSRISNFLYVKNKDHVSCLSHLLTASLSKRSSEFFEVPKLIWRLAPRYARCSAFGLSIEEDFGIFLKSLGLYRRMSSKFFWVPEELGILVSARPMYCPAYLFIFPTYFIHISHVFLHISLNFPHILPWNFSKS